jgi:hypothetical protein
MPTHGPELRRLSISQLVEITGMSNRTVSQRLRSAGLEPAATDGKAIRYDPRLALPVLYDLGTMNPQVEKARYDKVRADLSEIDLAVRRGELMPLGDAEEAFTAGLSGVTQRMRAIPSRVAPVIRAAETDEEGEHLLRREIDGALAELAAVGDELARHAEAASGSLSGARNGLAGDAATADLFGEPMGGRGETPIP